MTRIRLGTSAGSQLKHLSSLVHLLFHLSFFGHFSLFNVKKSNLIKTTEWSSTKSETSWRQNKEHLRGVSHWVTALIQRKTLAPTDAAGDRSLRQADVNTFRLNLHQSDSSCHSHWRSLDATRLAWPPRLFELSCCYTVWCVMDSGLCVWFWSCHLDRRPVALMDLVLCCSLSLKTELTEITEKLLQLMTIVFLIRSFLIFHV